MSHVLGPDFFIVGAPKCATTSLNAYLGAHPAIFMAHKEQHFFGSDLSIPGAQPFIEGYLAAFAEGQSTARRGEASVWYLRSKRAAEEIRAYHSGAQIIAVLRNPLDMLPSYHNECLWSGWEDIEDFEEALAAEADRRNGRRIPPKNGSNPWFLLYRDVVRFHEQVERYLSVFGRNQVYVLLFDDLVERPAEAYNGVLEFLGVASTFTPPFAILNSNKYMRSRIVRGAAQALRNPAPNVRRIGRRLIPVHSVRSMVAGQLVPAIIRMNTRVAPRPPMDPQLRSRLAEEFAPDIEQLAALLRRDLSHWYTRAPIRTDLDRSGQGVKTDAVAQHNAR